MKLTWNTAKYYYHVIQHQMSVPLMHEIEYNVRQQVVSYNIKEWWTKQKNQWKRRQLSWAT